MPGRDDAPIPDPLIWLAYLAAATSTIRLATGILILPQREPLVLAKTIATLDHLSGGRVDLGVGVGWLEEEFSAIGIPFRERAPRTDEAIAALRALWTQDQASFHGAFFNFDDCISRPQPVRGTVPIHIGGHSESAARRAGRLGDGFFPASGSHEELAHLFGVVHQTAEANGRDPHAIELTTAGNGAVGERALDEIGELEALGVDRVILPAFLFYKDTEAGLERYRSEVISQVS
jgi:probable F420-dependent oxidoreductase